MAYTLHRCRFCGQTYYGGTRHRCPPPPPPPPPPPWVRKQSGDETYLFATIALTLVALAVLIGLSLVELSLDPSVPPWAGMLVLAALSGCGLSAVIGGVIGAVRGRLWYGVFWSLLSGPLGWLLAACAQDPRPRCPWCQMVIPDGARVCGHCARQLPQA